MNYFRCIQAQRSKYKLFIKSYTWLSTLVIVEHRNQRYSNALLNAITFALKFGADVRCIILGDDIGHVVNKVASIPHISKVYYKQCDSFKHPLPELVSPFMYEFCKNHKEINTIIVPSTSYFQVGNVSLIPRLASLFKVAPLTDVISMIDKDTFCRPTYAGNIITRVRLSEPYKIITIRPTMFLASEEKSSTNTISDIIKIDIPSPKIDQRYFNTPVWLEHQQASNNFHNLSNAKIVLAGGRAFKTKQNFELLYQLANKLKAAGASRAAVDAGFCTSDLQIGQTGKIVLPDLYFSLGISGAVQHISGMKDSKVVVSINTDHDCSMFKYSDYCVVDDIFNFLPQFERYIKQNE